MAYDDELAGRLRDLLHEESAVTGRELREKRMFGGLAFLVDGNMALAASSAGGLMVRVDPDHGEQLVTTTPARPVVMRGRPMRGWLEVDHADLADDDVLAGWVRRGASYAATLPAKAK
ncbi:TfoX-like protein [Nocardioides sp. J9]|uniref:TfoX/Sxy family protein n=1 Tax=unclassified Nocardioides TaxID=2615069 RepID=UPI000490C211|nr:MULTISPECIES: TfoX/Sxy family protein [unclassified Nocardioides]TWG95859.1 TfoX-like protein [Nocardioides sp. J9]